jgi:hypothetical protein
VAGATGWLIMRPQAGVAEWYTRTAQTRLSERT